MHSMCPQCRNKSSISLNSRRADSVSSRVLNLERQSPAHLATVFLSQTPNWLAWCLNRIRQLMTTMSPQCSLIAGVALLASLFCLMGEAQAQYPHNGFYVPGQRSGVSFGLSFGNGFNYPYGYGSGYGAYGPGAFGPYGYGPYGPGYSGAVFTPPGVYFTPYGSEYRLRPGFVVPEPWMTEPRPFRERDNYALPSGQQPVFPNSPNRIAPQQPRQTGLPFTPLNGGLGDYSRGPQAVSPRGESGLVYGARQEGPALAQSLFEKLKDACFLMHREYRLANNFREVYRNAYEAMLVSEQLSQKLAQRPLSQHTVQTLEGLDRQFRDVQKVALGWRGIADQPGENATKLALVLAEAETTLLNLLVDSGVSPSTPPGLSLPNSSTPGAPPSPMLPNPTQPGLPGPSFPAQPGAVPNPTLPQPGEPIPLNTEPSPLGPIPGSEAQPEELQPVLPPPNKVDREVST